jgi:hypothetical protein
MELSLDGANPTTHEDAVARRCDGRILRLEATLAKLLEQGADEAVSSKKKDSLRAKVEMAQTELEFWRAKRARLEGMGRHEGRVGYWLVPREPTERALRRANGLTDLADISSSPHNMQSTLTEIALAVRIVIETDGVPVMQSPCDQKAVENIDIDERLEAAKEVLFELDNARSEFVKLAARYLELREGVVGQAANNDCAATLVEREQELDRIHRFDVMDGPLAKSVEAWRKLMASV